MHQTLLPSFVDEDEPLLPVFPPMFGQFFW
jgi:hypothetical protein